MDRIKWKCKCRYFSSLTFTYHRTRKNSKKTTIIKRKEKFKTEFSGLFAGTKSMQSNIQKHAFDNDNHVKFQNDSHQRDSNNSDNKINLFDKSNNTNKKHKKKKIQKDKKHKKRKDWIETSSNNKGKTQNKIRKIKSTKEIKEIKEKQIKFGYKWWYRWT